MLKFYGGRALNSNVPLELQKSDFGELDEMQNNMICNLNALDLVLLENANELFRMLMQEGEYNNNIEKVMKMITKENKNSIYLPSRTFDIKQNLNDTWVFDQKSENRRMLQDYICECRNIISKKVNKDSIIFTIIGLDLGEGGHYGAIICDIKLETIYIFDSMSGDYDETYYTSATQKIFANVAKKIFIGDHAYSNILNTYDIDFKVKNVRNKYILQPTGGFEDFIAPPLEKLNNPKNRKLLNKINLQHTESQNHFCYIWGIWFCQIYLRGKKELYEKIIKKFKKHDVITLVVIKKYILNIMQFLEDVDHKKFFYRRFPQLWSNHDNPLVNEFKLYEFEWKKPNSIQDCLDNSLVDLGLKEIEVTSYKVQEKVCRA